MVHGLGSFAEWFKDYEKNYVIIGGTACDLLMTDAGDSFRATKDIDIVIVSEELDSAFGAHLWDYINSAGYEHRSSSKDRPIFYRFSNPKKSDYPVMIELFSRRAPGFILPDDAILTPLTIDDYISSLSAILLDDEYYNFLKSGVVLVDGVPVLDAPYMIPFKAKAWLDLTKKKASGGQADSRDIKKHKNDICRLMGLLTPEINIKLPEKIRSDLQLYLDSVGEERIEIDRMKTTYMLSTSGTGKND